MPRDEHRALAAVLGAALFAVWGAVQYVETESAYQRQSPDPFRVSGQDARLADFSAAVPAGATLGYLTDVPLEETLGSSMFYTAQYYLAPRLLQKGGAYGLVLGNFTKPADFAALGRQHGLRLERDYGNGVVLFRREARP